MSLEGTTCEDSNATALANTKINNLLREKKRGFIRAGLL